MKLINKILYKEVRVHIWTLIFVAILMLATVGLEAIGPWPFKILIDNVLSPNPLVLSFHNILLENILRSRYLLGFLVVLIYFVSSFGLAIVEYVQSIMTKKMVRVLTSDFSKKAFKNMQSLAIGFYKNQQIGDYIYRLSYDVGALGELLEEGVLPLVTSSLYLIVTVTVMLFIDVNLTLLALAAVPFLAIGLYSFNAYISYATKKSESFNSASFSFIEEALTHLKIIQAFSQEHRESKAFDKKTDIQLTGDLSLFRLDFLLTLLVGVIIAMSYSVIILYGIHAVFGGVLTTGLLIVFIFYLDNLTNPLLSIIYAATSAKQSYIKIMRMSDFFTTRTHLGEGGAIITMEHSDIRFEHVTLSGDKNSKILKHMSFTIEANKRTVIFGINGSGKTSVVNLILRFIDKPDSGGVFVGGINIQDYNLKFLRDNIAFVPQEITLFSDSIRNNIAFGSQHATKKDIEEAARLAGAHEFIMHLPGGYDFQVGEGGGFVSGGQRQRLMLARALMKKQAKILLFDETFSALDVKSRMEVLENIYHFSQGKTTIIVSNIFEVVSAADNVVVLNKGEVIYSGPSSRLPKEISLYKMIIDNN
jgi:ABC-type multidrug transport system fused ATPase/permease subunit